MDLNIDQEAAVETRAMEILETPRLATTMLVLFRQFGDPGQVGRLAVNHATAVKKRDREAAPDHPALAVRKIRIHATRSNAQRWNHGAAGLRAIVALKSERELGTARDRIQDLSVQKNSNSSKVAPARLKHHVRIYKPNRLLHRALFSKVLYTGSDDANDNRGNSRRHCG